MTESLPDAQLIQTCLEQVSARVGDPYERIYARLFEQHPEFEPLFDLDTDGGVRAHMLSTSFECILGVAEGLETPAWLLEAARVQHEGYGLSPGDVQRFFVIIRDECRAILAAEWTPPMEAVWGRVLCELENVLQTHITAQQRV